MKQFTHKEVDGISQSRITDLTKSVWSEMLCRDVSDSEAEEILTCMIQLVDFLNQIELPASFFNVVNQNDALTEVGSTDTAIERGSHAG